MDMDPSVARARLLEQHQGLRDRLELVHGLVRQYASGEAVAEALGAAVAGVATAFDEHNAFEETLLTPMLAATDGFADVRIARMVGEHTEEHRAFSAFLASPLSEVATGWADFAEEIAAHMEAEERTFLHPWVLRDDLVTADTSDG
jgi:hemerythrin-like domain-containing protein